MALALASFWNPGYTVETWHVFLIFQAMNFLMVMYNIFLLKRTIWLQDVGCKWHPHKRNFLWGSSTATGNVADST